jgi:hypothetical protein
MPAMAGRLRRARRRRSLAMGQWMAQHAPSLTPEVLEAP